MRVSCLLLVLAVSGCHWLPWRSDAGGNTVADALGAVKSVPYDEPGTRPKRPSPEVVSALAGPDDAAAREAEAAMQSVRLFRIEQALAVAKTEFDRAWLRLEEGQVLASLDRCDAAAIRFREVAEAEDAPHPERLRARAELERIERGVCFTTVKWDGYRYRPAPKYPPKRGPFWIEGDVELLLYVSPYGGVRDVAVVRSTWKALEPFAVSGANKWRFEPLVVDGVRIPFVLRQTLQFYYPQILVSD